MNKNYINNALIVILSLSNLIYATDPQSHNLVVVSNNSSSSNNIGCMLCNPSQHQTISALCKSCIIEHYTKSAETCEEALQYHVVNGVVASAVLLGFSLVIKTIWPEAPIYATIGTIAMSALPVGAIWNSYSSYQYHKQKATYSILH